MSWRFFRLQEMNVPYVWSFGDEVERIREVNALTGEVLGETEHVAIFPATHFVTNDEHMEHAVANIKEELEQRLTVLRNENKLLEAQRLEQRTITILK